MENILKLEKEYADFTGSRYCVACSSGTSALHLSLLSCGVGKDDEVIVPDFSMCAIGFAVSYCGAKVVTVDCGTDFNIDVSKIEEKITDRTKAIIAVHTYGRLCDIKRIKIIADEYNLRVIEDGCEAQGATISGDSHIQVFSFYKNKIIHAEEGGIICTDDKSIADDIRDLKNMAFGDKHDYFHERIGFNYRMPDSQAKMALDSLHNYEMNKKKRQEFDEMWDKLLPAQKHDAVWVHDYLCKDETDKKNKVKELNENGIEWRHFFKPLSSMPMFRQSVGINASSYASRGIYICYYEN